MLGFEKLVRKQINERWRTRLAGIGLTDVSRRAGVSRICIYTVCWWWSAWRTKKKKHCFSLCSGERAARTLCVENKDALTNRLIRPPQTCCAAKKIEDTGQFVEAANACAALRARWLSLVSVTHIIFSQDFVVFFFLFVHSFGVTLFFYAYTHASCLLFIIKLNLMFWVFGSIN